MTHDVYPSASPSVNSGENILSTVRRAALESTVGRTLTAAVMAVGVASASGCDKTEEWPKPNFNNPEFVTPHQPGENYSTVSNFYYLAPVGESGCGERPCNSGLFFSGWPEKGAYMNMETGFPAEPGPIGSNNKGDMVEVVCEIPDGKEVRDITYKTDPEGISDVWKGILVPPHHLKPEAIDKVPEPFKSRDRVLVLTQGLWLNRAPKEGMTNCADPKIDELYGAQSYLEVTRPANPPK